MEEESTNITMKNASIVGVSYGTNGVFEITLCCCGEDNLSAIINEQSGLDVSIRKK